MDRRTFSKTTLAGALATLLPSWPEPRFREVGIISRYGAEPFDCDLTLCDICLEDFTVGMYDRPAEDFRKFVYDSREQLTVCEHCLPKYLVET